ncbi:competence protein CoiA [Companilactobacillus nantensis]|nr:competence protein CoiA family protein [Companilactobacillus nantensis]GEO63891.1 hypothetical protein LNA01_10740 [Companilactobacillus nantensis]
MYAALDERGTLIYAQEAVESQKYFCCHCDQQVKLILTESRKYFRHANKSNNSINERLIHQKGKQLILDELANYDFKKVESEYYLADIQQRPDIFINRELVIEYQCARIDESVLEERVAGYRKLGLESIWILGGAYLEVGVRREHLKFISYSENYGYFLLLLDSLNQRLTLFHHIKFIGPFNKIFYQREIFSKDNLPNLFTLQVSEYPINPMMMQNHLLKKLRQKNDPQSQWVKMNFYQQNGQTVEAYLEDYAFVPQAPIYQTPAWQQVCGIEINLLKQPLLRHDQIKKPPQL